MLRYLFPLGLFVILSAFLYLGLYLDPRDIGSTLIGKPAPAFILPQVEDTKKTLSDQDFKGKVSLFNAWASWCVSCRHEHALLMRLAKQEHILIYGLNYKDKLDEARVVLKQEGNPYIASAYDANGRVGIDWGLTGTPETFVIDKQGIVQYKHTGVLTEDIWKQDLLPLIQQLQQRS